MCLFINCSILAEDVPIQQAKRSKQEESPMDTDDVISDPEFLQSVLENLPGVDPQSEAIRDAVGSLNKDKKKDKEQKWKKNIQNEWSMDANIGAAYESSNTILL